MKSYLLYLSCFFSTFYYAQKSPESTIDSEFITKEITFKSEGIDLSGTLYKPTHPDAAIVLVHGSGQEKRMEKMALLLAQSNIAVLTYDKRGVGKSGGVYMGPEVGTNNLDSSNLNLLALDASAAITELMKSISVKNKGVALMGFSQAGWIIPLAAEKNKNVKLMIIFSGPLVNTLEQLRFQFYTEGKADFWDTHTEAEAREHLRNDPDKYQFAPTDPIETLAKLSTKGLWLFGGKDVQIPVNLSIEHLNELKSKRKSYEYKLFPELGHNTAFAKSQEPMSFAVDWIKKQSDFKKKNQ